MSFNIVTLLHLWRKEVGGGGVVKDVKEVKIGTIEDFWEEDSHYSCKLVVNFID